MERTIIRKNIFQLTDSIRDYLAFGIGLACLFLFITSAINKIGEHERFMNGLSRVHFIGEYAWFISWAVPVAEIIISLFLVIPKTQRLGFYCFVTLIAVFTGYIVAMMLWAENLPCNCNLIIEKLSWEEHIWFNLGFIALSIFALWLGRTTKNQKIKT